MKSPNSKNTINWQRSIEKRNQLIDKAKSLNIKLDDPHSMKIKHLEDLVNNHLVNKHLEVKK